ncbi:MAG: bifunctional riboflavin kinase/FAD synthetase, partial [Sulfurospirillum sp.]
MKSFTTLKKTQIDSLALGGFDGVHIAHQKLLGYLGKRGAMLSIYRDTKALTPKERRCKYVNCGCFLVLLDDIKDMSAKEFVEFLSKEFKNLKKIVIGYDFHFGKGRSADYNTLK